MGIYLPSFLQQREFKIKCLVTSSELNPSSAAVLLCYIASKQPRFFIGGGCGKEQGEGLCRQTPEEVITQNMHMRYA